LRWQETNGSPVWPRCHCLEHYDLKARRRLKCAACYHHFGATSGTILVSHKLSFVDLLRAICLFVNVSKGLSAVQLTRYDKKPLNFLAAIKLAAARIWIKAL